MSINSGTKSENMDKFSLDKYLFQRVITMRIKCRIIDEGGNFLFFIARPPFKNSVIIYGDEKRQTKILSAEGNIFSREYKIQDQQGLTIGRVKKKRVKGYWEIFDSQGIIKMAEAREVGRKGHRSMLVDYDISIGENKVGEFIWDEPKSQKVEGAHVVQAALTLTDKILDRRPIIALMGLWGIF